MSDPAELRELLHRLSNQLGVILAHAELLEAKAPDEPRRARAAQIRERGRRCDDDDARDSPAGDLRRE
jgi:two-component sensor histidine kinase